MNQNRPVVHLLGVLGVLFAILYANASVSSVAVTPVQSGSEKAQITLNNVQKFSDFINGCMTQIRLGNIEFLKICTAVMERMNIELAKFNVDNSAELQSKFVDVPFFVGSLAEQDSSTVTGTTDLLALKADSRFGTELLKQLPNIVVACGTAYDMVTTCPVLLNSLYDHVQRATELNQHDYDTMGASGNNGLGLEPSLGENDSELGFGNKSSPSANGVQVS
jgi:hypothetical protein